MYTLPTVKEVINHKNWTGLSLKELVDAGRLQACEGASNWITHFEQEAIKDGQYEYTADIDQIHLHLEKTDMLQAAVINELNK